MGGGRSGAKKQKSQSQANASVVLFTQQRPKSAGLLSGVDPKMWPPRIGEDPPVQKVAPGPEAAPGQEGPG